MVNMSPLWVYIYSEVRCKVVFSGHFEQSGAVRASGRLGIQFQ